LTCASDPSVKKILHLTSNLSRSAGGPFTSIRRLAQCQQSLSTNVNVVGVDCPNMARDLQLWEPLQPIVCKRQFPRIGDYSPAISPALNKVGPDLLHLHGLWTYTTFAGGRWAQERGTSYVISPRGMLEPWALDYHWWKKRPVWWGWEKRTVERASLLHATAEEEADHLRALGLKNPIAVIPNGADLPAMQRKHHDDDSRIILFLSRIHPKKGLMNLVKAWSILRPANWKVVIAGPSQIGHAAEVRKAIVEEGLEGAFEFSGPVYEQAKWELYGNADLFVLPTYSENFGMVVAEALASGAPVITTKGAPWKELVSSECGWWIDIGVEPLVAALRDAIALSDADREAMGRNGRRLIEEKYPWPKIAQQMLSVYAWIEEGGIPPDCVRLWNHGRKVFA
jgi:glycosyltransferase involved in cell wall biosynthesis